ncbi:AAA family ATPase [Hyphomonas oceanitis]|uniref:Uncharacterized protein n=1 Tax=Hyphomonas oceanitis SCH89 TaxID=1280953 RepID=A0A059GC98_9PROT|nr:AAA family ATPase [Hyphomonas oceanitis]KDA04225.1 hypothetical protein HOC_00030 [Hyphomonas oceanitis SCH89]
MKIRISDWRYENLRIGAGTEEVTLGTPPKRWSLIQMPNGTGKTTTMALIRAVLGEEALNASQVRAFRANDEVTEGKFELGLLVEMALGEPAVEHRLTADFDFANGSCTYSTLRPAMRSGGREPGRVLPDELQHLLKPDFIKLFVFDGELARDIRQTNKRAADQAIRTLYQLDEISNLRQRVSEFVKTKQDQTRNTTGRTQKGVTQARRALEAAEEMLKRLETQLQSKSANKDTLDSEHSKIRKEIDEHVAQNKDLEEQRVVLDAQADGLKTDIQASAREALLAFRNPATLSSSVRANLTRLGKVLTDARLPKSPASEFFAEIAKGGECICGRTIGEAERLALEKNRDRYLAHDQINAIATMKTRLNRSGDAETDYVTASLTLQEKLEDQNINQKKRARLELEAEERGDKDLADLRRRAGVLEERIASLSQEIEKLSVSDAAKQAALRCDDTNNVPLARSKRDACEITLREVSDSFKLSQQRDMLLSQLQRIEQQSLETLRELIRIETNKRLEKLVRMEELRVARIDGALELTSDKVERRDNVSEGQSLSVAYAFLTSLLSKAPFDLPFVVDSPAVSLDLDVRREVSRIIPNLFNQMVLFVISSERAAFAETFYQRPDTQFVTLEKRPDGGVGCLYGLDAFKEQTSSGDAI